MTCKRCAYLTMDNPDGWTIDADLGFEPLRRLGWEVVAVPWRTAGPGWSDFDAVYVGSPWDYPEDPTRFLEVLESVHCSDAVLVNDLSHVKWSMHKTYLRDLEERGALIVPSRWMDRLDLDAVSDAFRNWQTERVIVKPVVSTNAIDTFLLTPAGLTEKTPALIAAFADRPLVLQPFIDSIVDDGEFSLFYFNGEYSHTIRKKPKQGDFRVQEEYGAEIVSIEPVPSLLDAADRVISLVEPVPAYARADFVRGRDGRFLVMELELVEPSMYLRMNADAPRRFAEAFDQYVKNATGRDMQ